MQRSGSKLSCLAGHPFSTRLLRSCFLPRMRRHSWRLVCQGGAVSENSNLLLRFHAIRRILWSHCGRDHGWARRGTWTTSMEMVRDYYNACQVIPTDLVLGCLSLRAVLLLPSPSLPFLSFPIFRPLQNGSQPRNGSLPYGGSRSMPLASPTGQRERNSL